MKIVCCLISLVFLVGCQSVRTTRTVVDRDHDDDLLEPFYPNPVQGFYLQLYTHFRKKWIANFGLSENATLEDFRPHVAKKLGLPEQISWIGILTYPKVEGVLTESRRAHVVYSFHFPENYTWMDIAREAEELRRRTNGLK